MILTKELNQVTLKKCEEGVSGKTGLSFIYHSLKHYGVDNWLTNIFGNTKKSNREISAGRKIMTGALSIIAGGSCVEDIENLRSDKALVNSLGWVSMVGADTFRRFLGDKKNGAKIRQLNNKIALEAMRKSELKEFTYDNDATYFESNKNCATYSYHKEKEFSGLLGFIAELGICNTVDFRPGNINPRSGILNQLRKANQQAKSVGKRIARCRIDSAGHQEKIFKYCNDNDILYYISLTKNEAVKLAIKSIPKTSWQPILDNNGKPTGREYAETIYVLGEAMRVLVLRWANPQLTIFEQDEYLYHAIATNNNEILALDWLKFHNGRMASENYNKELKHGLSAEYTPSHDYQQNRAWFLLNILAYNMIQVMKQFYLGKSAETWTTKTLRYKFINVCGKIICHGRLVIWKIINVTNESFNLFRSCLSKVVIQT